MRLARRSSAQDVLFCQSTAIFARMATVAPIIIFAGCFPSVATGSSHRRSPNVPREFSEPDPRRRGTRPRVNGDTRQERPGRGGLAVHPRPAAQGGCTRGPLPHGHRASPFGPARRDRQPHLETGGTHRAPRRLFTAHMDTVPVCLGCRPVRVGQQIRSSDPGTGLGADDRAGCAVLLNTALEIVERRLPHPPLTFCWFVQEEIGLHGARHLSKSLLGNPRLAFNFDGGSAAKLTVGATGGYRMVIDVLGLASHAGHARSRGSVRSRLRRWQLPTCIDRDGTATSARRVGTGPAT